jgi:N-acetylglucosaminyldiphosphoundecaprenol N-acetyl-beta-D-mannosaminyltransferase
VSERLATAPPTARPGPFGWVLCPASAQEIADGALRAPRTASDGAGLVVTPNIDHIAWLRRSSELAAAYRRAALIVCDGWPVRSYARLRGADVQRVTGCDIAARLMRVASYADWHRLFFVIDNPTTQAALADWATARGVADRMASFIPPFGFERDANVCAALADAIRAHGTTLLFMAIGAPRSEVFVDRFRDRLPPCWCFCVGQAVKVELGLVRRAPGAVQALRLEWLWRIAQEPRRLAGRYLRGGIGFALAVLADLRRSRVRHAARRGLPT